MWELFFSVETALKNSLELLGVIRNFVDIISAFLSLQLDVGNFGAADGNAAHENQDQ